MSQEHHRPELHVESEGPAEGIVRGLEEEALVPNRDQGAAAQDDDVPHCGFHPRSFVPGVARDGHERFGRFLAGEPLLEEIARLPERLAAARHLLGLQELDCLLRRLPLLETEGVLRQAGFPRCLLVLPCPPHRLTLLEQPFASLQIGLLVPQIGLLVPQALLPGRESRRRRRQPLLRREHHLSRDPRWTVWRTWGLLVHLQMRHDGRLRGETQLMTLALQRRALGRLPLAVERAEMDVHSASAGHGVGWGRGLSLNARAVDRAGPAVLEP